MAPSGLATVYWQGHGSEHIEGCTSGYHWIAAPAGGIASVPQFFSSIPADNDVPMFRPSGNNTPGNAAWHYNSGLVATQVGVTPHITFQGDASKVKLIISHCLDDEEQERLVVSKTVDTYYERTHKWDIAKRVETENEHELDGFAKIWLSIDGDGNETAEWTVDVTYDGYDDGAHNVSGGITIVNTGDLDAAIQSVVDVLGGTTIAVDCGVAFPYTLPKGETLSCTYDEDGLFEGNNVVTVTTALDTYSATEPIVWGDPDEEHDKTVNVEDISDLFGTKDLGSVTAPNGDSFTYDKDFAYADYGQAECGAHRYDNTASIVETGQSDDATLKVNVQCYQFESAWAKGTGETANAFCDNGFNNWGWSNAISRDYNGSWPLYAGAGQCDISKAGDPVGYFEVSHTLLGGFSHSFVPAPGVLFEGAAVYAGSTMFPKLNNGRDTTAPGQYSIANPPGINIHVIAHVNAGIPDPNFGPN